MKKIFFLSLLLMGCASPPVIPKFPDPPEKAGAMENCPDLQKINEDAKLSDISKTITVNYGTYYECAVKSDIWIEWYKTNKDMFSKIGK